MMSTSGWRAGFGGLHLVRIDPVIPGHDIPAGPVWVNPDHVVMVAEEAKLNGGSRVVVHLVEGRRLELGDDHDLDEVVSLLAPAYVS